MFDAIVTTLLKSKYTWIALAVLAVGITMYSLYTQNQNLKAEKYALRQDNTALSDSVNKQRDTIQTIAASVQDLNKQKDTWKDKYVAVQNKYDVEVKGLKVQNDSLRHATVIGDSVIEVPFLGKQGLFTYNGKTSGNIKTQEGRLLFLNIDVDPIDVRSTLFFNDTTKLWTMRTVSMTPGVILRGYTALDDETFRKIAGVPQLQVKVPSTFGVGGLATFDRVYGGFVFAPERWMFSVHYMIFNKVDAPNMSWSDKLMIGVHYFIF